MSASDLKLVGNEPAATYDDLLHLGHGVGFLNFYGEFAALERLDS